MMNLVLINDDILKYAAGLFEGTYYTPSEKIGCSYTLYGPEILDSFIPAWGCSQHPDFQMLIKYFVGPIKYRMNHSVKYQYVRKACGQLDVRINKRKNYLRALQIAA